MIKIKNYSDRAEIFIYGDIVTDQEGSWLKMLDDGTIGYQYPEKIKKQLDELKGLPIDVHIASDGGDVAAGIAIYNMLNGHDAPVTVYVDSWAASIASFIAFAGQKIVMPENTFLMIHNPKAGAFGDHVYLRSVADWLQKIRDMLAKTYADFAPDWQEEEIMSKMDAETWLTALECAEMFRGKVELAPANDIQAVASLKTSFKNAPERVCAKNINDNDLKNILSVLEGAYKV